MTSGKWIMVGIVRHEQTGWLVDPKNGIVYGVSGKPLLHTNQNGYVRPKHHSLGRGFQAHRIVWEAVHGPIAGAVKDAQINHINGVKNDNRISNLELVTAKRNINHSLATGLRKFHGSFNPLSKLTYEMVSNARDRYRNGETYAAISRSLGVSQDTIRRAVNGTHWKSNISGIQEGRGRLKGQHHQNSKLSESKVVEIRSRYEAGEAIISISKLYCVSTATVRSIVTNRTWRHV